MIFADAIIKRKGFEIYRKLERESTGKPKAS